MTQLPDLQAELVLTRLAELSKMGAETSTYTFAKQYPLWIADEFRTAIASESFIIY